MKKSMFWKSARQTRWGMAIATLLALGGFSPAGAIELADNLQLHGFASQALIVTDSNRFFGSGNTSLDFRELGLNLSWRPLTNLRFSAQGTSRWAGHTDTGEPRLDFGFMDFTFLSDPAYRLGVRGGRVRNPIGLYNLTRDVANTRPSIFLPQSIYFDSTRNTYMSVDGGQFYGEYRSGIGDFFLDFNGGYAILDEETLKTLKEQAPLYVGRLLYEYDGGRIRLGVTLIDVTGDSAVKLFPKGRININAYIFSAQYNAERWSLTSEWIPNAVGKAKGFTPFVADSTVNGTSYYLQGTYKITPEWEALLRYDVYIGDKSDENGKRYAASTGGAAHSKFAEDMTVGLGWTVTKDFLLRAEYHHINGSAWVPALDNPNPADIKQHWNLFALQASYAF
ncbi:MAG: hypothetical protein PHE55_15800 [Methylococcaceae bacterium]|nr:hypothetical protein [Methylococcaceae bacterium]